MHEKVWEGLNAWEGYRKGVKRARDKDTKDIFPC